MTPRYAATALIAACTPLAATAQAADEAPFLTITISGSVAIPGDHRFGGVRGSDRAPAVRVSHASGFHADSGTIPAALPADF
jgi:hypothetical protein